MRRTHLFIAPFAMAVACGGTPTTTTTPTATTATPPASGVVATNPAQDMSPVTKPKSVVLVARLNDLGKTIDSVDHLVKLPATLRSIVDGAMQKEGAEFIQLNGSFDVAVALDSSTRGDEPEFLYVVSIPVKSIDDAVQKAEKHGEDVRPSSPGAYRIKIKDDKTVCDLVPSAGDAPARAVCTDKSESLSELTPYMARGLAAEPKKTADLWVRVDFAPFKDKYIAMLKSKADGALGEVRNGMSRELGITDPDVLEAPGVIARELFAFADDADAVEGAFTIDDKAPSLQMTGSLQFRSKTSWVTQLVTTSADHPDAPPDMFFRLPKDATAGSWGHSADPAMFQGIRKVLHKGLGSVLAMPQLGKIMSDSDKQALVAWVDGLPSFSGSWVSASGMLPIKKGPEKNLTAQQAVDEAKNMARQYVPWAIGGGDGDPAAFINWLKLTEDALNRGVADVTKVAGKDAAKKLGWLPVTKFTKDAPGYPKGSATLDVTVNFTSSDVWEFLPQNKYQDLGAGKFGRPPVPKGEAKGSITLRIAVVPDEAGHYWWGYATDPEALKAHLNAVIKGAPASGQLSARTDLEPLKSHKGFGGFYSYGSILETVKNSEAFSASDRKDFESIVSQLPHKAQGSIYFLGSATDGGTPSVSIEIVAGKDAVEDLGAAVSLGARMVDTKKKEEPAKPPPAANPPAKPPTRK